MGIAVVLSAIFGPLGLLYVTLPGGLLMTAICLVAGLFTLGLGALLMWPVCIVWSVLAVNVHNRRLSGSMQAEI